MSSLNQSNMNDSRNTSRRSSLLFSNRTLDDSMASRQSRENSLISTNRYKSPFYEGKVSFGGSSAKRVRLSQVLPYNLANKPTTITRIKDSDIKRSNEFDQLSSATKHMLDNIYKTSSPLEDAKRIPVCTPNQSNEKFMIDVNYRPFKRLSSLRTPKLVSNLKTTSPMDREKLQLKWEELENSTSQSLNASLQHLNPNSINNLIADASSSYQQRSYQEEFAGGKIRNRTTRRSDDDVYPPQYELPNIALPIDSNSLPVFNLNRRSTQQPQQHKSSNVNSLKRPLVSITQEDDSSDAYDEFKFSAPKAIKLEKISDSFLKDSIKKSISDLPKSSLTANQITSKSNQPDKSISSINFTIPKPQQETQQQQQPKPPSSTNTSTTDLMNLEANKTVEMYKLDKLESDFNPKENKATLANTNLPIKSAADIKLSNTFNYDGLSDFAKSDCLPSNKKWTCDTCAVKNELTAAKCIACEQPRLKECKDKNVNSIYSNYSFGTINLEKKGFNAFKLDTNKQPTSIVSTNSPVLSNVLSNVTVSTTTSTLSSLLTNSTSNNSSNKIDLNTPADKTTADKPSLNSESITLTNATATAKPATNEQIQPFNFITNEVADKIDNKTTLTNTWGTQFLPPKSNWNCPGCFTSNKSTDKKCPCCEEPNPNEPKVSSTDSKSSTALSFGTSSTGGFKFNLAPSTTPALTTKSEFSFANKLTSTTNTDNQSKGFSFANLTSTASTKSDDKSTAPKFTFNPPAVTSNLTTSTSSTTSSTAAKPINLNEPIKPITTNLNSDDNKTSSLFSIPQANAAPSFTFGQQVKDANPLTANKSSTDQLNKPASSNFVFGNMPQANTSNLNNGELSFNLSSSTNQQQQQPQSTGLFSSLTSNNSSAVTNTSNLSSFNQFGNKAQFGSGLSLAPTTASSTNIFSPPSNLTNGFTGSTTITDNNLFSNSIAQPNNQPAVNNFSAVFSQVPPSFNFGSNDQSQNNSSSNVFQFSA